MIDIATPLVFRTQFLSAATAVLGFVRPSCPDSESLSAQLRLFARRSRDIPVGRVDASVVLPLVQQLGVARAPCVVVLRNGRVTKQVPVAEVEAFFDRMLRTR